MDTVTAEYFAELTGFTVSASRHQLRIKLKKTDIKYKKEFTYLKNEVDDLAASYIEGKKPIQSHEIDRNGIMKKFRLSSNDIAILIKSPEFPNPKRKIFDQFSNNGMQKKIWDRSEIELVDVYGIINRKILRNKVRKDHIEYFSWSGLQAQFIHCCVGDWALSKKLGINIMNDRNQLLYVNAELSALEEANCD